MRLGRHRSAEMPRAHSARLGRRVRAVSGTFYSFTPGMIPEEDLVAASVGRERLIKDMAETIRHAASGGSTAHILLVGPRGIGKTNTLLRLQAALKKYPELEVARLSEEEYSISSFGDLLSRIMERAGVEPGRGDAEDRAVSALADMKKRGKSLVVVAENLQMLFAQMSADMPKLRSFLQEHSPFCIAGSATEIFDEISSYDKPFYNFMNVRILHGLGEEETIGLIRKRLARAEKLDSGDPRWKRQASCIRALTGGNPRLIHCMCDTVLRGGHLHDLRANLLDLLDQLTPYYQARMDRLPPMQRKMLDRMALAGGPITPTALAKNTGMKASSVVTQLRRMSCEGLVEPAKLRDKRETPYQVSESLYRMWREMRTADGPKRVGAFVDFVETWYSEKERLEQHGRLSFQIVSDCMRGDEQAARDNLSALACAESAIRGAPGPAAPIRADPGLAAGDHEFLRAVVRHAEERQAPNRPLKTLRAASLSYARRALAEASKDELEAAKQRRQLEKCGDRVLSALQAIQDEFPELRDSAHVWCHQWVGAYGAPDDRRAKYEKLLSAGRSSCVLCATTSALARMSEGRYGEALGILDKTPAARLGRLAALRIPCLVAAGRAKDAERDALDLASGAEKHVREVLASLKWADPDVACRIAKRVMSRLSVKGGLEKAVAEEVAGGLSGILADAVRKGAPAGQVRKIAEIGRGCGMSADGVCSAAALSLACSGNFDGALDLLGAAEGWDPAPPDGCLPLLRAAVTYMKTGDTDVLEGLHKDARDLAVEMAETVSQTRRPGASPLAGGLGGSLERR